MENTLTRSDERVHETVTLSFTGRIANWSARHRWWVVAASVTMLVLAMVASSTFKVKLLDDNDFLEGESGEAIRLLEERFDDGGAPTEQLVFSHPSLDVDDPVYRSTVEELVQELRATPEVSAVVSYYETGDPRLVSTDRRVQRAQVVIADIPGSDDDKIDAILETVYAARPAAGAGGFYVGMAGDLSVLKQVEDIADEDLGRVLIVTLVLALVMLLLVFRAVVASLIPLALAVGAIIIAMGIAALVSQAYPLTNGFEILLSMLGLAVGIDYSLFIISRFRYERQAGREKLEAITVASNTTGRAVFYAGVTVMVSLAGLALTNNPVFISLALGVIFVVMVAIVGSLTFLPAVLSVLGDNVNRLRVPILGRANGNGGLWNAITKRVLDRPILFASVTASALIALAAPVYSLDLVFSTGSQALHNAVDAKQAVVLLEEHFSGGLATPALVVVDAHDVTAPEVQASVAGLVERVGQDSAFLGPFETVVNPAGDLALRPGPANGGQGSCREGRGAPPGRGRPRYLRRQRSTGLCHWLDCYEHGLHRRHVQVDALRLRLRIGARLPAAAGHVPVHRNPGEGDPPEPPVSGIGLRSAGDGLSVGMGGQPAGLRGPGRDRTVDAANPLYHRVRPLHGLPHAAAEPDQRGLRPGAWERCVRVRGNQVDRRADHERRGHHGGSLRDLRSGQDHR